MELDLSLANDADIPAITEFCDRHRGKWLPVPNAAEFKRAISEGWLFMAAETGRLVSCGSIHAVAGTFTYGERLADSGRSVLVHELASMVVDGELGGLNPLPMQQLMLALRIVALARALSEDACLLVSVAGGNVRSIENVLAVGATEFNAPAWLKDERSSWCSAAEVGAVRDFIVTPVCFKIGVRSLRAFVANPSLFREERNSRLRIERRFRTLIPWLTTQALDRLEAGDVPMWETSCPV